MINAKQGLISALSILTRIQKTHQDVKPRLPTSSLSLSREPCRFATDLRFSQAALWRGHELIYKPLFPGIIFLPGVQPCQRTVGRGEQVSS